jgi:uncharacterized protein YegJ (DUF2314 family)
MLQEQRELIRESIEQAKAVEYEGNVVFTCPDCSDKMYPNAGKFTHGDIRIGGFVKFPLIAEDGSREFIWAIVLGITGDIIYGTLDNEPIFASGHLGDPVSISLMQVVEVME